MGFSLKRSIKKVGRAFGKGVDQYTGAFTGNKNLGLEGSLGGNSLMRAAMARKLAPPKAPPTMAAPTYAAPVAQQGAITPGITAPLRGTPTAVNPSLRTPISQFGV